MIRDLDDKGLGQNSDSSLLSLPCRLFFVTSFDAFLSESCRLPSLLFKRFGGPGCWFSHQWCGVDGRKSCCRLVRMVFVEQADELSKVLDR